MRTPLGAVSVGSLGQPRQDRIASPLIELVVLAVAPALLVATILITIFPDRWVAYDFHWAYYPAASRLLHGGDPYLATPYQAVHGLAFVYPALSAVVLAPFALLTHSLADHLYTLFCLLLVPATLRALDVRDWRIYGAVLIWMPVTVGWQGGNMSVPLVCLTALAWRHRDRPVLASLIIAAAISIKPFLWPLALWLPATGRWRTAAWALAWGLILNLMSWWLVGFDRVSVFLHVSAADTSRFSSAGYGVIAAAHRLGLGAGVGEVLMALACLAVAAALVMAGRRGNDARAFIFGVALMLLASPLVWSHYFSFLVLPLALARPRFSAIWLVPIAMWVCPPSVTAVGWQVAVAWSVAVACFAAALLGGPTAELVRRLVPGRLPGQTIERAT